MSNDILTYINPLYEDTLVKFPYRQYLNHITDARPCNLFNLADLPLQTISRDDNGGPNEVMGPLDPNWQASMCGVRERQAVMLNNGLLADVVFLVGSGSPQRIPAHKYMLAAGSSVFYAMFYGELAENKKEITIPDVEPQAFRNMLKWVMAQYTDLSYTVELWCEIAIKIIVFFNVIFSF